MERVFWNVKGQFVTKRGECLFDIWKSVEKTKQIRCEITGHDFGFVKGEYIMPYEYTYLFRCIMCGCERRKTQKELTLTELEALKKLKCLMDAPEEASSCCHNNTDEVDNVFMARK